MLCEPASRQLWLTLSRHDCGLELTVLDNEQDVVVVVAAVREEEVVVVDRAVVVASQLVVS